MKKLIITGIIVVLFASCGGGSSTVDKSISQIEKALQKVEKNKGKMTESDWRNLEKEVEEPLKAITDAMDKNKVGIMGKMKIVAVTAKWAAVLAEAGISEFANKTGIERENFGKELEKVVKELENNTGDLNKELEKAAKELEKLEKLASEQK